MSTGVHLHWEMWAGKTHGWSADGSGFVNAVKFFKALIAQEKELAATPKATEDVGVVAPAPVHEDVPEKKPEPAPAPAPTPKEKSEEKPKPKASMYTVKSGDSYWAIGEKYHAKFGGDLALGQYVKKLQTWNKNKGLNPGDKIRVN
jgi:nucleoid-associated protein YgaU